MPARKASAIAPGINSADNCSMTVSPWQRRIERAQELANQHTFAAEILGFFIPVARFQKKLHEQISPALRRLSATTEAELNREELVLLGSRFESFLSVVEAHGPQLLARQSQALRARGKDFWGELLGTAWTTLTPSGAEGFLAQTFLQPYAELLRSSAPSRRAILRYAFCPFCNRKPVVGVLRQMGDGAARSLVCGFCLNEWEFRRIVCPGCGEENEQKLPVFTAADFDYIRLDCCDSCKTYLKTIDLTVNGHAEPIVDEIASAHLDLWARDRGYTKLQKNLLGM
jgi:FdhE protein